MSYALAFAPEARSQWQALDAIVQELFLDAADAIAEDPPKTDGVIIHDFSHSDGQHEHYFVIRMAMDSRRNLATVIGVMDHVRNDG